MIDFHQADDEIHFVVHGAFDFESSLELIRTCNAQVRKNPAAHQIKVTLKNITYFNSCAIGALLVLSDMVKGQLHISLIDCHADVHRLFDSGLIDHYFGSKISSLAIQSQVSACLHCFNGACQKNCGDQPHSACFSGIEIVASRDQAAK